MILYRLKSLLESEKAMSVAFSAGIELSERGSVR